MSDSMWFIELGTICVTVAVVVRVWWLVVQVLRARNKRRLLSRMFGVVSDSPDFIGISAICHDIDSVSQVADLLDCGVCQLRIAGGDGRPSETGVVS